jgi:protein-disulfide isomerase
MGMTLTGAGPLIVRRRLLAGLALIAAGLLGGCNGGVAEAVGMFTTPAEPKPAPLAEAGPLGERTLGVAAAPVTVIEYGSLGCPICRVFHKSAFPRIKRDYIDTGKVFFIYREFPIGKSPAAAAATARCVPEKHFFRINKKFMNTAGRWNGRDVLPDALYKIVQDTGLSRTTFDSCLANQNINDGITWVKQRGRELGVEGTPTFFINGQKVRGIMKFDEMRKLIEQHLRAPNPV